MAINHKQLGFSKAILALHVTMMAVISAERLRLVENPHKMPRLYEEYKRELFSDDKSPKRRRHIGFVNDTPSGKKNAYLFCKTGFFLQIHNSGRITGTSNISSENALLEIQIFGKEVRRVKGVVSGRYLSINNKGRLTSTFDRDGKNTFFIENDEENAWYSYSWKHYGNHCSAGGHSPTKLRKSRAEEEWFIAIKENGSLRRPCKTRPGMRATHFFVLLPENIADVLEGVSSG